MLISLSPEPVGFDCDCGEYMACKNRARCNMPVESSLVFVVVIIVYVYRDLYDADFFRAFASFF